MTNWRTAQVAEFCDTGSGGTPSRNEMQRYYEGGTIPWIKSGELRESVIRDSEERITEVALRESSAKLVPAGALLLAMYGATVGRLAILGIPATTNQAVCHIVPDPNEADVRYLFHFLLGQVPNLVARGVGGAQPNISQGIIKELKVPLPPLAEQRRIAAILDQADALRAKRRQALAELNTLTQSIFLEMFGDPATNPKGLPTISLGELGEWASGGTPPRDRSDYFEGTTPWFSSGELEGVTVTTSRECISDSALKETSAKQVPKGALMLGMYDTAALKASFAGVACSCNQAVAFALLDENQVDPLYVYHAILTGREHFRRLQRGIRQKNLNLSMIREIRIPLPERGHQRVFVEKLNCINRVVANNKVATGLLEVLFASVQQRAFRGEL